jgi:hypothetical protein
MNKLSWIAGSQFPSVDDFPLFCHIPTGSGAYLFPIQYCQGLFQPHESWSFLLLRLLLRCIMCRTCQFMSPCTPLCCCAVFRTSPSTICASSNRENVNTCSRVNESRPSFQSWISLMFRHHVTGFVVKCTGTCLVFVLFWTAHTCAHLGVLVLNKSVPDISVVAFI